MNRTTATGLFIILTFFSIFVNTFAGQLLFDAGLITGRNSNGIVVTVNNVTGSVSGINNPLPNPQVSTNGSSNNASSPNFLGWRYSNDNGFTYNWEPGDPSLLDPTGSLTKLFNMTLNAIGFFAAMMTFQVKGAEILSPFWWFVSILWFWLIILIARGNQTS